MHSHSTSVLGRERGQVPLIENRERALGAEIEPILGDQRASLPSSTERGVVNRFRIGVLDAGGNSIVKPAPQLERAGLTRGITVRPVVDVAGRTAWTRI